MVYVHVYCISAQMHKNDMDSIVITVGIPFWTCHKTFMS